MPIATDASVDDEGTGLLDALWRYRFSSFGIVLVFALLGLLVGYQQTGQSTATVTVALKDPRGGVALQGSGVSSSDLPRYTSRRADFATTYATLHRAAEIAGTDVEKLRSAITAVADPNTDAFRVVATTDDQATARRYADAVAVAYRQLSEQSLNAERDDVRAALEAQKQPLLELLSAQPQGPQAAAASSSLAQLDDREAQLSATSALFGDGVEYMDRARVHSAGASTALRDLAIGTIFGLVIAALAAWFRASRRPRAGGPDEVSRLLATPFLGEVPAPRSLRTLRSQLTRARDGYDIVSTTLSSLMPDGVVLFVSPTENLGRTETAARAALAVARDGRRVLVVDADHNQRHLSRLLGVESEVPVDGPATNGHADPLGASRAQEVGDVCLDIASGPRVDDVATLYRSRTTMTFLAHATTDYELVAVDCAPFLESAAAGALARSANGVVVVVEAGTALSTIKRTRQQLDLLDAPIIGFVYTQRGATAGARPARV